MDTSGGRSFAAAPVVLRRLPALDRLRRRRRRGSLAASLARRESGEAPGGLPGRGVAASARRPRGRAAAGGPAVEGLRERERPLPPRRIGLPRWRGAWRLRARV